MEEQTAQENVTSNVTKEENTTSNESSFNDKNSIKDIIDRFDEILGMQLERLLDTRLGIDELPLNIFNVSSIVLLATRETEIDAFPYQPPPRYTQESLFEELLETSIDPGDLLTSCIKGLEDRGYLEIADDGRLLSKKSTLSTAQLLDRIFPNMPGLNMVAYLGQMIDEVLAKRKGVDEASMQFNQLLDMQGIPINSGGSVPSKTPNKRHPHLRLGETSSPKAKKKPVIVPYRPADIFSALEIKTVVSKPSFIKPPEESDTRDFITEQTPDLESIEIRGKISEEPEETIAHPEIESETDISVDLHTEPQPEEMKETEASAPTISLEDDFEPPDDTDIEERIAQFEEKLGLICPLCRSAEIKANETAKGKAYYQCANIECGFISWGKPFYIQCPKCENNFLIEAADNTGRIMLKCPRATCTHWQKFPWDEDEDHPDADGVNVDTPGEPKKKVRRVRRVVRRKKRS